MAFWRAPLRVQMQLLNMAKADERKLTTKKQRGAYRPNQKLKAIDSSSCLQLSKFGHIPQDLTTAPVVTVIALKHVPKRRDGDVDDVH
jgi:hypothetical protein